MSVVGIVCSHGVFAKDKTPILHSPDQSLSIKIGDEDGSTSYSLLYKNKPIISKGTWGLQTDEDEMFRNGDFMLTGPISITDTLKLRTGLKPVVKYQEYDLNFQGDQKIQVRMFDNAFAFRYTVDRIATWNVKSESSSWTINGNPKTWFFERENDWKLKSYAGEWVSCPVDQLNSISPTGPIQGTPLVFDFGSDVYGFLAEAALYKYSGMRLQATNGGTLTANFTEKEGFDLNGKLVSPWRVFYIGEGLNGLVNQHVIKALNPKPDPELFSDLDYIKPGKSAWRWWSKRTGTPEQEQEIAGFASELNFEYSLIDEGWEKWENTWETVKRITENSAQQHTKILLWKHSKELDLPGNDYQVMKESLDNLKASGAVGAKVDFMNSESKPTIDFDIKLLQEAAKRKLLIVFHGCQKPSGESYTYPNELTREGIRGLELNGMKERPITASHNAALPFTRFIVGDGDYTPLGFTNPGNTTWTHQLATLICFDSYLEVIAEDPEFLLKNEKVKPVLPFIKNVPTVWNETIVLPGSKIGEVAAIAKRADGDSFIGVLNTEMRNFTIDFSFLDGNEFDANIIEDTLDSESDEKRFSVHTRKISNHCLT